MKRVATSLIALCVLASGGAARAGDVREATLLDTEAAAPEVSTAELQRGLAAGSAVLIDVRSALEFAIAHIPEARNVWEEEIERLIERYPDRSTPLVLYCNGPHCNKSRRVSRDLVTRGYGNVRRYQLGLPVWRALGNAVQTDAAGVSYLLERYRGVVLVDAREPAQRGRGAVPGAVAIRKGEAQAANGDGRLPHHDKGTPVIVFGATAEQARAVAEEIARKAYWNSSYFGGNWEELRGLAPATR